MSREVLNLYSELLQAAEDQRAALMNDQFEDAERFVLRRQGIIDRIKDITPVNARDSGAELAAKIAGTIKKIILIDDEMKGIVQKNITALSGRFDEIQKTKAFFQALSPHRRNNNHLDLNV